MPAPTQVRPQEFGHFEPGTNHSHDRWKIPVVAGILALFVTHSAAGAPPAVDRLPFPVIVTQVPLDDRSPDLRPRLPGTLLGLERPPRLVLLRPGAEPQVLVPGFYATADPDVFFDGKKMLFAGKQTAQSPWRIYELDLETRTLRELTRDNESCRNPAYQSTQYVLDAPLPWFQVSFLRELPEPAAGLSDTPVTSLFSCRMDGSHVRRLTVNTSADLPGALLPNGRIVYPSFRVTYGPEPTVRVDLLAVNTDGTDPANFLPGVGSRFKLMPAVLPQGLLGKVVFVENDELLPDGAGQLACVDLRRPLRTYRRLTDDPQWVYHSPSPLPDGRLLVSRRRRTGEGSYGLGLFDLEGRTWTPLFDDPRQHDIFAVAVTPRPLPDGRSSGVDDTRTLGTLYCLSVYDNDLGDDGFLPGSIKKLRILEGVPPVNPKAAGNSPTARWTTRVLGEIPVFPDGSFQVEVPADTPLILQLLDENGMNLRSSGWLWVKGAVHQGCIGCHEDPERVPFNRMPNALWEERPKLQKNPQVQGPDFLHDVFPIVQQRCLDCHGPSGKAPVLVPSEGNKHPASPPAVNPSAVYELLTRRPRDDSSDPDFRGIPYVVPGAARLSPLVWHIASANLARPWDEGWRERPFKPWPPDAKTKPLTAGQFRTIVEWIDCGAWYSRELLGEDKPSQVSP